MPPERATTSCGQLMSDALYLRLGRPDAVDRRPRLQPDRLSPRHRLAARQLDRSRWVWPATASGTRPTASPWRCSRRPSFSGHRLPEAFSGYPRSVGRFPVPYPTACSPQAWATGAPLAARSGRCSVSRRATASSTVDPRRAGRDRLDRDHRRAGVRQALGHPRQGQGRSGRGARVGVTGDAAVASSGPAFAQRRGTAPRRIQADRAPGRSSDRSSSSGSGSSVARWRASIHRP